MKKRVLLTILMITMIMGSMAQKPTMTLTFTADNNGQHLPLNSILIENLTQGGDTMLYAPDSVLVLDYTTGMEELSGFSGNGFSISQNYPNPMEGKTTIDLLLKESEKVVVTVSNILGSVVANQEIQLEPGRHSFTFYPGSESLYLLTARASNQTRTIKMFNTPTDANVSGYCKLAYNGQLKARAGDTKSGNALNNFVFDLGDQLKFTSFTDQGERVVTSSPTTDQSYYFHYTGEPCPDAPTVTDIDGNVYNTVQIGNQCWMKENLKTTTYRNGTAIPNITGNAWSQLTSGAYAWYYNDISWKDSYGALYNWYTTVDPNGLCPTGWHVPTDDDWTVLIDYIDGNIYPNGRKIKSCRQVNTPLGEACNTNDHPRWAENGDRYGTDDYGFSGLPGGHRFAYGSFGYLGSLAYWWSSTDYDTGVAYCRYLVNDGIMYLCGNDKRLGFSVRCLRD